MEVESSSEEDNPIAPTVEEMALVEDNSTDPVAKEMEPEEPGEATESPECTSSLEDIATNVITTQRFNVRWMKYIEMDWESSVDSIWMIFAFIRILWKNIKNSWIPF